MQFTKAYALLYLVVSVGIHLCTCGYLCVYFSSRKNIYGIAIIHVIAVVFI